MKISKVFITSMMLSLSLTSCGQGKVNTRILKNGDLLSYSSITYENAFREGTFEYLDTMMNQSEPFVLYLTSKQCSHCTDFKSVALSYVQKTNNLVVKLELVDSETSEGFSENFTKFYEKYNEYFFVNGAVYTPQIYIANGLKFAESVPSARYTNSTMFNNAMNSYVATTNVESITTVTALDAFRAKYSDKVMIFLDRNNTLASRRYHYALEELAKSSNKHIALFELNDETKESLKSVIGEDYDAPIGVIESNGKNRVVQFADDPTSNMQYFKD